MSSEPAEPHPEFCLPRTDAIGSRVSESSAEQPSSRPEEASPCRVSNVVAGSCCVEHRAAQVRKVVAAIVECAIRETSFIDDLKDEMVAVLVDVVADRAAAQLTSSREEALIARAVEVASRIQLGDSLDGLTDADLGLLAGTVPTVDVPRSELVAGVGIIDLLARTIADSKAEALWLITQGAAYINNHRVHQDRGRVTLAHLATETMLVVRGGKKDHCLVCLVRVVADPKRSSTASNIEMVDQFLSSIDPRLEEATPCHVCNAPAGSCVDRLGDVLRYAHAGRYEDLNFSKEGPVDFIEGSVFRQAVHAGSHEDHFNAPRMLHPARSALLLPEEIDKTSWILDLFKTPKLTTTLHSAVPSSRHCVWISRSESGPWLVSEGAVLGFRWWCSCGANDATAHTPPETLPAVVRAGLGHFDTMENETEVILVASGMPILYERYGGKPPPTEAEISSLVREMIR